MPEALIRLPEVMARTGLSKTTIYRRMAERQFPQQVRQSVRVVAWPASRIDEYVRNVVAEAEA